MVWAYAMYDSSTPGFRVREFLDLVRDVERKLSSSTRRSLAVMSTWVPNSHYDLNLLRGITETEYPESTPWLLALMCYTTIGHRIDDYREIARARLRDMRDDARRRLLEKTLEQVRKDSEGELNNWQNTTGQRISEGEKSSYMLGREDFWKKRIESVLQVKFQQNSN